MTECCRVRKRRACAVRRRRALGEGGGGAAYASVADGWTHAAVLRGDQQLGDLSAVDAEDVLHLAREDVPHDDGEVHAAGHQRALVVARRHLVGVQQARHLVSVATQRAMGRPACSTYTHEHKQLSCCQGRKCQIYNTCLLDMYNIYSILFSINNCWWYWL